MKPPKLVWVRFRWSRVLGGEIRSPTLSRKGGHWFASFLIDDHAVTPARRSMPDTAVGIDRGVKTASVTSGSGFYDRPFTPPTKPSRKQGDRPNPYSSAERRLGNPPRSASGGGGSQ